MSKKTFLPLIFLLFFSSKQLYAQKFQFFGIDSLMNHTKSNIHYVTTLEHYFSENLTHYLNDKPISITQLNTTADYYLFNRLAIGGNLLVSIPRGEYVKDFVGQSANTVGIGIAGSLRWELLNLLHHNFYIETAQGMLFTANDFPPGGTPWNFSVRYGLGYTVHLSDNRYLVFGWRWMHISNGTGLVPTNPAYDGNGIYIGFKFSKDKPTPQSTSDGN